MKNLCSAILKAAAISLMNAAHAVPPGLTLQFVNEDAGTVIFSGTAHSEAGLRCASCHLSVFDVSRAAEITRADHRSDQFCFGCHDGDTAFGTRGHCSQCHQD